MGRTSSLATPRLSILCANEERVGYSPPLLAAFSATSSFVSTATSWCEWPPNEAVKTSIWLPTGRRTSSGRLKTRFSNFRAEEMGLTWGGVLKSQICIMSSLVSVAWPRLCTVAPDSAEQRLVNWVLVLSGRAETSGCLRSWSVSRREGSVVSADGWFPCV